MKVHLLSNIGPTSLNKVKSDASYSVNNYECSSIPCYAFHEEIDFEFEVAIARLPCF